MNKLRIVVIIGTGIMTPRDGFVVPEALLKNFLELLAPLSDQIYTIVGDFPFRLPDKVHIIRIKGVGRSGTIPISVIRFLQAQLKICYNLCKIAKDVDVVIFHIGTRPFALPILCSKLLRKKTASCATGNISKASAKNIGRFPSGILKILERINFQLADQLAVESPIGVEFMGLNRFKNKIIINGAMYVNTAIFRINRSIQDRKNLIGYIGRLTAGKGVKNFVQAMPLILKRCDDLKFLIGGGGPLFDEIKNDLQSKGLSEKVELTGWIPHDVLPKYLNELRLFVFPSYSEGLPGAVQEAMACGTPVVATSVGCVPDLIRDGETGFIMEDNSPKCIAKNVIRALEHSNLEEIVKNAKKLIEDEYSYDVMVRKCRDSLEELMKDK